MIFPKTILIIRKDVKFIQEIDQTIINSPFYKLRKSRQHGNWSIIGRQREITCFKKEQLGLSSFDRERYQNVKVNSLCTLMAEPLNLLFLDYVHSNLVIACRSSCTKTSTNFNKNSCSVVGCWYNEFTKAPERKER